MSSTRTSIIPLFMLLLVPLLVEGQQRYSVSTVPGSGVTIDVEPVFEELPSSGYVPTRVTISNNSGRERTWQFQFNSNSNYMGTGGRYRSRTTLTVPDGEAKRFDLLVPVYTDPMHTMLHVQAVGPGISDGHITIYGGYRGHHGSPVAAVAMSPSLSPRNLGPLEDRGVMVGSTFALHLAPSDWRGWSGFDSVWMTDDEWEQLDAARRQALLEWTAAGGRLFVARPADDEGSLPDLPVRSLDQPSRHGFGAIELVERDGERLDEDAAADRIRDVPKIVGELTEAYRHPRNWELLDDLGPVEIHSVLFISFLIGFAVVIGPVNLFVFAPAGRRHRLFWTTPLLSVGASLFVVLLILGRDGTGGEGLRQTVWLHLPQENKVVTVQEQVARTSLLLSRTFEMPEHSIIRSLDTRMVGAQTGGRLSADGTSRGGDWFRSRSVQAHLIENVQPTRWRIEIASPGTGASTAREIVSTFPFSLDRLYYRDEEERLWTAETVESGTRTTLSPVENGDFNNEWRAFHAKSGGSLGRRTEGLEASAGYFFAFVEEQPQSAIATLSSIEWQRTRSLHLGPVTQ